MENQESLSSPEMKLIPLHLISAGNNPRKFFDNEELEELAASIRTNGVLQPILVRESGTGFVIVAGERRYRAALLVFGAEGSIPAVVREMTDEEADAAALIENSVRAEMSVTEEAVAAGRILAQNNGDRVEAAAILGWPVSKLNRRLALLNLTEDVMTALNERRILVGHAELLAAVPKEKQDKALNNILNKNLTVQQVKEQLAKVTTEFSKAIFATEACASCQHNSSQQANLFTESVGQGRCTNSDCFKGKTLEQIQKIKTELEEECPNVRLVEIGDPANYVTLVADGELGVGEEQLIACKGCGNFGATISTLPGEEGKIERGICFDAPCHKTKVVARIKAGKAATTASEAKTTLPDQKNSTLPKKAKSTTAKASTLSEKVKEYRRKKIWNMAAQNELRNQPSKATSFLLDLLLTGSGSKVNSSSLADVYTSCVGESEYRTGSKGNPEKAHALIQEHKRMIFTEAVTSAVPALDEERVKALLTFLETDLANHWAINDEFLNLLTKSEIEAVCADIGLTNEVADFKKIISGKKDDIVKAIMASGFDFAGKVPSIIKYAPDQKGAE